MALRQGRELMRQMIEVSLHLQKAELEKRSPARVRAEEAASWVSRPPSDDSCGGNAVVAGVLRVFEMPRRQGNRMSNV